MANPLSQQNLSALAPITTAAQALSNLILVSPQKTIGYAPQNKPNADGKPDTSRVAAPALVFHYEGEQSGSFIADITDHYVEDNSVVADQIALKPEEITTRGYIGELNDIAPIGLQTAKFLADKLTVIGAYAPSLSVTALVAYQTAFQLYQTTANAIDAGVAAWSSLGNALTGSTDGGLNVIGSGGQQGFDAATGKVSGSQNKQQVAFQQLYGYQRNRTLFTIQTPWAIFQNMAIKSLNPIQSDETNVITEFSVTFKMIRFASTQMLPSSPLAALFQGRAQSQSASPTDVGTSTPQSSIPLSSGLSTMGVA